MNVFRRRLRIAFVVQLALAVLALPAAHVHRHGGCGPGGCVDGHVHVLGCSHAGHDHETAATASRSAPGELSIAAATDSDADRCAACELQRLIGQAYDSADRPLLEQALALAPLPTVATIDGLSLDAPCCRGPPIAC